MRTLFARFFTQTLAGFPQRTWPSRAEVQRTKLQRRAGFTLLELLVVITMMIFITTIAAMNYFGAMRAAGYTAVSNTVFNSLLMARQRACLDNKQVYLYLLDPTNYVMMEAFGTLAKVDNPDTSSNAPSGSQEFYDPYVDATAFSANMTILDIDAPGTGAIVWRATTSTFPANNYIDATGQPISPSIPACSLHVTNNPTCPGNFANWKAGDRYGTPIFASQMLPKGFAFSNDTDPPVALPSQVMVLFQPDGTVDTVNNISSFRVFETLKPDAAHSIKFTISPTGIITQQ